MKLLMFQARHFAFHSFLKTLDSADDALVSEDVPECVVVFIHAEADDDMNRSKILTKMLKNVKWMANKREVKKIVLHSFTHLSSSSSSPQFAQDIIEEGAERLKNTGYLVWCTPFGYLCEWDLSVYGESLARVFKEF